jgi:hypothetical protein
MNPNESLMGLGNITNSTQPLEQGHSPLEKGFRVWGYSQITAYINITCLYCITRILLEPSFAVESAASSSQRV